MACKCSLAWNIWNALLLMCVPMEATNTCSEKWCEMMALLVSRIWGITGCIHEMWATKLYNTNVVISHGDVNFILICETIYVCTHTINN